MVMAMKKEDRVLIAGLTNEQLELFHQWTTGEPAQLAKEEWNLRKKPEVESWTKEGFVHTKVRWWNINRVKRGFIIKVEEKDIKQVPEGRSYPHYTLKELEE
jgi:hypothetical protein